MKYEMKYWIKYLSFKPQVAFLNNNALSVTNGESKDHNNRRLLVTADEKILSPSVKITTVVPFELMLREIKYHHVQSIKDEIIKKMKKSDEKNTPNNLKSMKNVPNPKDNTSKNIPPKGTSLAAMKAFNTLKEDSSNDSDDSDRYCYNPLSCTTRVPPINAKILNLNETRSHLCVHKSRLMGRYKIVYFMQCVRILWPLTPGVLKPIDNKPGGLSAKDILFIRTFHNVTKNTTSEWYGSWTTYPPSPVREDRKEMRTVLSLPHTSLTDTLLLQV